MIVHSACFADRVNGRRQRTGGAFPFSAGWDVRQASPSRESGPPGWPEAGYDGGRAGPGLRRALPSRGVFASFPRRRAGLSCIPPVYLPPWVVAVVAPARVITVLG